jgi:hypothetical protein
LKLALKRMDKMTAEKGYAGPVVVCSVNYEPIAGHRANVPLVKYLSDGREMEIALAPIAARACWRRFGSGCEHARKLDNRGQSIRNDRASIGHFTDAQRGRPRIGGKALILNKTNGNRAAMASSTDAEEFVPI